MIVESGAEIDASCTILTPQNLIIRRGAYIARECFLDATGGIEIGEGVRISFRCVIMSNTHPISRSIYRRGPADVHKPVVIERGCWIGAHVTIYPGVTIREGCVINAGSVIMKDTEPHGLYNPPNAVRVRDLELD
jgi:putative colanic acid biosynthesis acetyltransferase WcaF